jgi:hypothetical protein
LNRDGVVPWEAVAPACSMFASLDLPAFAMAECNRAASLDLALAAPAEPAAALPVLPISSAAAAAVGEWAVAVAASADGASVK